MTNLREKANEIKAAGEAERGNFEPHGVPLRIYRYWLNSSGSKKANAIKCGSRRENFCHFWRVVAIWAPLMFFRRTAERVVQSPAGAISLIVGAIAALIYLGFISGDFRNVLLVILATVAAVAVFAGLIVGLYWVVTQVSDDPDEAIMKVLFGFTIAAAVVLVGVMLVSVAMEIGWTLLWATLIVAGVGLVAYLLISPIATYISGKRALRQQADDERREKFINGELSYDEYYGIDREPREPGKIAKFFSGLGDFIVLAAQVVRVNKWKICPMVEIDT